MYTKDQVMEQNKSIAVIGLGYVGLPLALLSAKKGYQVYGVDVNKDRVQKLKNNIDPIGDNYVKKNLKNTGLIASTNETVISKAKIILVCVPTPVKNRKPNLAPLKQAVESIAKNLPSKALIIIESTINPGVCDEVLIPLIEKVSKKVVNQDFYLAHCPERINPGDKKWTVENIPRVVGASSKIALDQAVNFYESIINAPIKPMGSLKEAESVKIVENSFRDINLAFVNELAVSFTSLGIDVKNVIDGASTKPFSFMPHYPSVGVGGHCIPVDPYYLIEYAKNKGFDHEFLTLARSINNNMPNYTVRRISDGLKEIGLTLKNSSVAVLGLTYKANVADDRESPSYHLIDLLESKGVSVKTYDPYLPDKSSKSSIGEAVKNTDAVVVAVNHKEFMAYDFTGCDIKVFIDGKNAFPKNKFLKNDIVYKGIGR